MKVGTAHSSLQNSHLKGLCHCATSAGTHLFKYCKKLRPLFQERKRNKMGFFNPSFHLVSNKPSWKGRSTDMPGLGSQSILLLQRYPHSVFPQAWAFPPGSEILPKMEQHVPSDDSCCCPKQLTGLSKMSQPWIFLCGYTEITRTQKYHLVLTKERLGREAENSACLWDPRLPHISSLAAWPSLTLASSQ